MDYIAKIASLSQSGRIQSLKQKLLDEPRYMSIEQAKLITRCYMKNPSDPKIIQRAKCLFLALQEMNITIDREELIVGNRTKGVRGGVVSPESGISWVDQEIESLSMRSQDQFHVHSEDIQAFRSEILPYWQNRTLEDNIDLRYGKEIKSMKKVVKINQTDHAQGHICPNTKKWLAVGPAGLKKLAKGKLNSCEDSKKDFYRAVIIVLDGAEVFMKRYGGLAFDMAGRETESQAKENLERIGSICLKLASQPPETFREAIQSLWFLYVILQMESNASSFSPGRADQYLYPYFKKDIDSNLLSLHGALEIIEALWLKFNQIVYLRNSNSARYFAGFPIGFNIACGGMTPDGKDASNELSYLFLKAQEHLLLPQPNLSVRLFSNSDPAFVERCSEVIRLGSGMPQVFNDESIIPALQNQGISQEDANNYAIVGCVELTTHGNNLGWSDAAMFNMVKVLELTLNNGVCMLTGEEIGLRTGTLCNYESFEALEDAYKLQMDYFIGRMIKVCDAVDRMHSEFLPSPFLSCVIDDCIETGIDVTAGGAHYNLSGIQAIQVANIADSFAAIKAMVYEDKLVTKQELLEALRKDFEGFEVLRQRLINKVPKYGNDVDWVDQIGNRWIGYFASRLKSYQNARGGPYHTGLYTVSAHVPMGHNLGASPDGRHARDPIADGGVSAMYGRDISGPTALLKSVSKINSMNGSNGTLLNMKFTPAYLKTKSGIEKFSSMLMAFVDLKINHIQFNVVDKNDLIRAKENQEEYRGLTIRVAGYTAYFTELAGDLQDEIIARTSYAYI